MTAEDVQTLIDSVPCDLCNSPPGLQMYLVLAAMIDISNGDPVPETTQGLITEANCLLCMVPPGMVPYLMVQALRGISSGGGSGSSVITCTDAVPVDPPTGSCAFRFDVTNRTLYYWDANLGQWNIFGGRFGLGSPEGVTIAGEGTTYWDTLNQSLWIKNSGSGGTGWVQLIA